MKYTASFMLLCLLALSVDANAQTLLRCREHPGFPPIDLIIQTDTIVVREQHSTDAYVITEVSATHYRGLNPRGLVTDELHIDRITGSLRIQKKTQPAVLDIMRNRCAGKITLQECIVQQSQINGIRGLLGCQMGGDKLQCSDWQHSYDTIFDGRYKCEAVTSKF